jgi:hypothetical protein
VGDWELPVPDPDRRTLVLWLVGVVLGLALLWALASGDSARQRTCGELVVEAATGVARPGC